MAFMDPPDGIGLGYATFDDRFEDYAAYLESILSRVLLRANISWLSFNAVWTPVVGALVHKHWSACYEVKPCVQTFTFGQHNQHDLGNNHRPLWRFRWGDAPLYPDAIRVPSWRQLNGDKRADPRGRVPGDVFDFPRVTGNSKQRRRWHPTQLHEDLVERCILLCTKPGDWVLDPYAGTGTTLRVCKRLGRNCTTIDIDPGYCEKIREENKC